MLGILVLFAVVTLVNMDPSLLAPSGYPPLRDIVSSVALTFFAFLGFGVITFTAKDLANPSRQLPRAMYLALGIATVIYVAVALGVFGTLTVDEVIASGGTALAVAAEPTLGQAGYWLMSVTALFATAGATNAGLYPAAGLSERLAATGQFPPVMGRRLGGRVSVGSWSRRRACLVLAVLFNLDAIASIGSAVALLIFTLGHRRPPPGPVRDRRADLRPGAGDRGIRSGPRDVHLHDPHPRARLDRHAGGHLRAQRRRSTSGGNGPAAGASPQAAARRSSPACGATNPRARRS